MYITLQVISGIKALVQGSPVAVVFDHLGGAQAALGVDQPGFADLVALVPVWAQVAAVRQKISVDNPARPYGF